MSWLLLSFLLPPRARAGARAVLRKHQYV